MEIYELPQWKITLAFYDKNLSVWLLELNGKQKLEKHNRQVNEELLQVYWSCDIEVFDNEKVIKKITLNEWESIIIPANQFHIHKNSTDKKSITMWKFKWDVLSSVKIIKDNYKLLK